MTDRINSRAAESLAVLERALASAIGAGADELELCRVGGRFGATRFSGSLITQSALLEDPVVQVRAAIGKRVGTVRSSSLTPAHLADAIARAVALARSTPEAPRFLGFAEPAPLPAVAPARDAQTAALGPPDRAQKLAEVFARARKLGLVCAGAFTSGTTELAVASSRGVRASHETSYAKLELIAQTEGQPSSSGYAAYYGKDLTGLDVEALTETACEKALLGKSARPLEPGPYDVLLEPAAVVESLEWMAMTAFGSRGMEDGSSFLYNQAGKAITGEAVTWTDDALSGACGVPPVPFDFEGVPKRRVAFVERGRAGLPCLDLRGAARAAQPSTGHAAPPSDEADGSVATHVEMAPGTLSRAELLSRLERGLLVTRFHYVNGLLDPRRAVQTGMTRDGLFLVEKGRITGGVRNLRWTEPMLEAFSRMEGASTERQAVATSWTGIGGFVAPTVLIRQFHFTGGPG